MTEYIEREAIKRLIESKMSIVAAMTKKPDDPTVEGYLLGKDHAIDWVEQIPAADVVEVVRCKCCKHRNPHCCKCLRDNLWHDEDDFCSRGERKEQSKNE